MRFGNVSRKDDGVDGGGAVDVAVLFDLDVEEGEVDMVCGVKVLA